VKFRNCLAAFLTEDVFAKKFSGAGEDSTVGASASTMTCVHLAYALLSRPARGPNRAGFNLFAGVLYAQRMQSARRFAFRAHNALRFHRRGIPARDDVVREHDADARGREGRDKCSKPKGKFQQRRAFQKISTVKLKARAQRK
jgi:hypothetical protein